MTGLHEELIADQKKPAQCKTCLFLDTLPDGGREEWDAELALPKTIISHVAIARAMTRRGFAVSPDAVRDHREKHAGTA